MNEARPPWRILGIFGLVALVARAGAALLVNEPPYLDPAYYELVARRLVAGDGFSVPVLWSFLEVGGRLPINPELPLASNGHWMPLTSIVSAGALVLFGPSHLAAELPMILLGSALVPVTGFVGWMLWPSRRIAVVSMVLALFAGPMLLYVPMADSFALFGMAGTVGVLCSVMAVRSAQGGPWLLGAGAAIALATLTRVDGLLLVAAPATAWLVRWGWGPWRTALPQIGIGWAVAGAITGAAILSPWLIRQWLVFGSPFPSAGGHTLWIRSYNEQFSIGHRVDLGTYLSWGPVNIIGSKLVSWVQLIGRTAVLLGGVFVFSFLYGLWRERRRAELAPFIVYFCLLFVVMGGLFTFHAPQGAYYHSAWAWLPFAIPVAVASFEPGLRALGRRWPLFGRERNIRFLLTAGVAGAIVLSLIGSAALRAEWTAGRSRVETAAAFLTTGAGPTDVAMYVDPPSLHLLTGNPVVAPPFDPPDVIEEAARAYGVRWLVLERQPGIEEDALGLWAGAEWLGTEPVLDENNIRIYEVEVTE